MRDAVARALLKAAEEDNRIRILAADISPVGALNEFAKRHPDRFINVGVAEQAMVGVAAGMALRGLRPFCYTIAPFALYRPFEFIRDDICYQNLPVTIIGMGAGLVYSNLGPTHHAIEDVAVACSLPNMQVLSPCDPLEAEACVDWCARENEGPVYLRIGKAGEPVITDKAIQPWRFGCARWIYTEEAAQAPCLVFHGPISALVREVSLKIGPVSLMSVSTLKPFDTEVTGAFDRSDEVIVIEENVPDGGLSSKMIEMAFAYGYGGHLRTFTLKDKFVPCGPTHHSMLAAHGLSADQIVRDIRFDQGRGY